MIGMLCVFFVLLASFTSYSSTKPAKAFAIVTCTAMVPALVKVSATSGYRTLTYVMGYSTTRAYPSSDHILKTKNLYAREGALRAVSSRRTYHDEIEVDFVTCLVCLAILYVCFHCVHKVCATWKHDQALYDTTPPAGQLDRSIVNIEATLHELREGFKQMNSWLKSLEDRVNAKDLAVAATFGTRTAALEVQVKAAESQNSQLKSRLEAMSTLYRDLRLDIDMLLSRPTANIVDAVTRAQLEDTEEWRPRRSTRFNSLGMLGAYGVGRLYPLIPTQAEQPSTTGEVGCASITESWPTVSPQSENVPEDPQDSTTTPSRPTTPPQSGPLGVTAQSPVAPSSPLFIEEEIQLAGPPQPCDLPAPPLPVVHQLVVVEEATQLTGVPQECGASDSTTHVEAQPLVNEQPIENSGDPQEVTELAEDSPARSEALVDHMQGGVTAGPAFGRSFLALDQNETWFPSSPTAATPSPHIRQPSLYHRKSKVATSSKVHKEAKARSTAQAKRNINTASREKWLENEWNKRDDEMDAAHKASQLQATIDKAETAAMRKAANDAFDEAAKEASEKAAVDQAAADQAAADQAAADQAAADQAAADQAMATNQMAADQAAADQAAADQAAADQAAANQTAANEVYLDQSQAASAKTAGEVLADSPETVTVSAVDEQQMIAAFETMAVSSSWDPFIQDSAWSNAADGSSAQFNAMELDPSQFLGTTATLADSDVVVYQSPLDMIDPMLVDHVYSAPSLPLVSSSRQSTQDALQYGVLDTATSTERMDVETNEVEMADISATQPRTLVSYSNELVMRDDPASIGLDNEELERMLSHATISSNNGQSTNTTQYDQAAPEQTRSVLGSVRGLGFERRISPLALSHPIVAPDQHAAAPPLSAMPVHGYTTPPLNRPAPAQGLVHTRQMPFAGPPPKQTSMRYDKPMIRPPTESQTYKYSTLPSNPSHWATSQVSATTDAPSSKSNLTAGVLGGLEHHASHMSVFDPNWPESTDSTIPRHAGQKRKSEDEPLASEMSKSITWQQTNMAGPAQEAASLIEFDPFHDVGTNLPPAAGQAFAAHPLNRQSVRGDAPPEQTQDQGEDLADYDEEEGIDFSLLPSDSTLDAPAGEAIDRPQVESDAESNVESDVEFDVPLDIGAQIDTMIAEEKVKCEEYEEAKRQVEAARAQEPAGVKRVQKRERSRDEPEEVQEEHVAETRQAEENSPEFQPQSPVLVAALPPPSQPAHGPDYAGGELEKLRRKDGGRKHSPFHMPKKGPAKDR